MSDALPSSIFQLQTKHGERPGSWYGIANHPSIASACEAVKMHHPRCGDRPYRIVEFVPFAVHEVPATLVAAGRAT